MTGLERHCRWLLRAYPAGYRRERGEEMLGTLLEATPPDRRWPALRDGLTLFMGGMRVRSELNQRLTMAAHLRLAVLLGVALMLLRLATDDLLDIMMFWRHWHTVYAGAGYGVAYGALTVAAVAAAFFAPRRFARALALVTAGIWFRWGYSHGQDFLAAIVLVMLAILVRGTERMPRLWLWLVGSLFALGVLQGVSSIGSLYLLRVSLTQVFWVILAGVVLWIGVDARPAIVIAVFMACLFAESVGPIVFGVQPQFPWHGSVYAAAAAVVAAGAIWRLRRQAVL